MRSLEELTLYSYGLLDRDEEAHLRPHVEACPSCTELVRRLKIEHQVFERAAARGDEPPGLASCPSRRPRQALWATGVAAVALLGVLVGLLFHPPRRSGVPEPTSQRPPPGDELDRLIGELHSASELRREMAVVAITAYGPSAVVKLEKAHADPALIDACRGITSDDRAALKKLKEVRVTFEFNQIPLTTVVNYAREVSQLSYHISGIVQPDLELISFKANRLALDEALDSMLKPHGFCRRVRDGVILILTEAEANRLEESSAPARVPLRLPVDEETLKRSMAGLESEAPDERDRATAALLRMGFGTEPALWIALDSPSPEIRARSSDLIRRLYRSHERTPLTKVDPPRGEKKLNMTFENAKLSEILTFMGDALGLPIIVLPSPFDLDRKITFKTRDLAAKNCFTLLLNQLALDYVVVDGMILAMDPGKVIFRMPEHPLWASPEEAKRLESVLHLLATGEEVDLARRLKTEDVEVLLGASRSLQGPASLRCRRAAAELAEEARGWLMDQPSGVAVQNLTDRQTQILKTECLPGDQETVGTLLRRLSLKHRLNGDGDRPVRVFGRPLKLGSLLSALTRPDGRDFYLEGETLVTDTSRSVRRAVER